MMAGAIAAAGTTRQDGGMRLLLNASLRIASLCAGLALVLVAIAGEPPAPLRITIISDSMTAEYRGRNEPQFANERNWLEILVDDRRLDAGAWQAKRPGLDQAGYQSNRSAWGMHSQQVIDEGHHVAVAQTLRSGKAQLALVAIGADDLSRHYGTFFIDPLPTDLIDQAITQYRANLATIVATIAAAGPVVLTTVPDWRYAPVISRAGGYSSARADLIAHATSGMNDAVREVAGRHGCHVIELSAWLQRILTTGTTDTGMRFDTRSAGGPHAWHLSDGVHIGSAASEVCAQMMITHLTHQAAPLPPRN
jgi:hypothetical protein